MKLGINLSDELFLGIITISSSDIPWMRYTTSKKQSCPELASLFFFKGCVPNGVNGKISADKRNRIRERDLIRSSCFIMFIIYIVPIAISISHCLRLIVVDLSAASVGWCGWNFLLQFFSIFS